MADSFVLLNDGTSFVVLNDGTSKVILNVTDVVSEGSSGGGIFARMRSKFRKEPPQVQLEYQEFYKPIRATATLSKTNEISFKSIPLLRQHMMRWFIVKPTITDNQEIPIKVNPTKEKHIHIAKIYCKLRSLLWVHNAEIFMNVRPKMDDYFTTDIHGKSLNGINIIRKAMQFSAKRKFEFRESSKEWKGADTLSDLNKRIRLLEDKLTDVQRDIDPREKTFNQESSFVGTVTYTPDLNTLEISLNGQVYGFCNVPERIFEGFEAAPSKGAYFGRNIKGQFNC